MPLVAGLTGLAGSGKSEASRYLAERYEFQRLTFSDILLKEAKKRDLLKNKDYEEVKYVLSKLGESLRKESGKMGILAEKAIDKIKTERYERTAVDGFRSVEEVDLFRENFDRFYLIFIDADERTRLGRRGARNARDSSISIEELRKRDRENIVTMGLGKVMQMADFRIENNNDLTYFHKEIDNLIKVINP
jgi:dephospho-CoA kinase